MVEVAEKTLTHDGDWVSGPETLTEEELGAKRHNFYEECLANKLDTDEFWQSRMPDHKKIKTPMLSTANWGGQGLHPRVIEDISTFFQDNG